MCKNKFIYLYIFIIFFMLLTSCNFDENKSDTLNSSSIKTDNIYLEENLQTTLSNTTTAKKPLTFDDYDSYINYIASLENFKPFYKMIFAFEQLPNGVESVPIENIKNMYKDLKDNFEYHVISESPLNYIGEYKGDTIFVHEYEKYKDANVNIDWTDFDGKNVKTTPLKTVLLDENSYTYFDEHISEGRNFQSSDFILENSTDSISVILGDKYKDIYKIGDTFSLQLIAKIMNFKVIGFYKQNSNFSTDVGALNNIVFDDKIIIPYFIPNYKPMTRAENYQHSFHIAELTSGCVAINKPVKNIDDSIYNDYVKKIEELAHKNDLYNVYKFPYWPVGFMW